MSELEQKLTELKGLLDKGLIDRADFDEQKRALLSAAVGGAPLGGQTRVEGATDLPERLGSYRVLGELGAGGMGTVLRARHAEEGWARRQGGDVAIKLIHPHIARDDAFRERFFAEAELGRKVNHPSIATVFDVLADGEHLGTVMSLVEGRDLSAFVKPGGLPVAEVARLLEPVAEALDHLHGMGIIHRDLKPANIKVRADGTPVILDLGIAKDTTRNDGQTATATAMGSVGWMAPEQADAKRVGPGADRYALGAIAYALLSGSMPWADGLSEARILSHKLLGELRPLGQVATCPPHVEATVMKMLSLTPSDRHTSCVRFVQSLTGAEPPVTQKLEAKKPAPIPAPVVSRPDPEATVDPEKTQAEKDAEFASELKIAIGISIAFFAFFFCGGIFLGLAMM